MQEFISLLQWHLLVMLLITVLKNNVRCAHPCPFYQGFAFFLVWLFVLSLE